MKGISAVVCLLMANHAYAEALPSDAPVAVEVVKGVATIAEDGAQREVELPKGLFLNEVGAVKLNAIYTVQNRAIAELQTQNDSLKKAVDEVAAEHAGDWKKYLIIALSGLAVGAAIGVGVAFAAKK